MVSSFSFQWIFLAGRPLFLGIIYLEMAGDVDVSEPDDLVSEPEELLLYQYSPLPGPLVQVLLFFLMQKVQRKDLADHGKVEAYICVGVCTYLQSSLPQL